MDGQPAKTNAERNREYRLRNSDRINQKKWGARLAEKAIITPVIEYEVKKIARAKKLPPARTEPKADITRYNYIQYVKGFYKKYTSKDLEDGNEIIKKIKELPYNAFKISKQFKAIIIANIEDIKKSRTDTANIYIIFRSIRGFTDTAKKLYPYLVEYKEYDNKRSVTIVADKEDLNISF